ncbi:hypothetical protein F5Y04DRAFT_167388 [Hypomontagnella monticulosa]|nr:hypothetical protein F5Y04DRAFT_167388 [Hypomontagnella monticulosa]
MADSSQESPALRLFWRDERPFVFCSKRICHNAVPNTEKTVREHMSQCFPHFTAAQTDAEVAILREAGALQEYTKTFYNEWINSFIFPGPIAPIPLLPTIDEDIQGCGVCSFGVKNESKMKNHYKNKHPDAYNPGRYPLVSVQVWHSKNQYRYVQVNDVSQAPRLTIAASLLRHLSDPEPPPIVVVRPENLEPNKFLEEMKFNLHLADQDLRAYSEMLYVDPDNTPIRALLDHLTEISFIARTKVIIDATPTVLLELNRRKYEDQAFGPWKAMILDESLSKYILTWARIICYAYNIYVWDDTADPVCTLNAKQQAAMENVLQLDWANASLRDKNAATFDLVYHLCAQQLRRTPFEGVVPSAFAVLGIDLIGAHTVGWKTESTYQANKFAALIKIFLLVVYMRATAAVDDQGSDVIPYSPSWTNLEEHSPDYQDDLDAVRSMLCNVMYVTGEAAHITPLTWAYRCQSFCHDLRKHTERAPKVQWEQDGSLKLVQEGHIIPKAALQHVLHSAVTAVEEALRDLLFDPKTTHTRYDAASLPMFGTPVPGIRDVHDDRGNRTPYYSFLDHSRNSDWVKSAERFLINKVGSDEQLTSDWFNVDQIDRGRVSRYDRSITIFQKALAVVIYLTAGQPPRRTELQILRWFNTPQGGLRNLMITENKVAIMSLWTKRRYCLMYEMEVWRFLPDRVGEVFLIYISVVLPFLKCVKRAVGTPGRLSSFLFSKALLESDPPVGPAPAPPPDKPQKPNSSLIDPDVLLTNALTTLTYQTLGFELNPRLYRHVAIAFSRKYMHGRTIQDIVNSENDYATETLTEEELEAIDATHAQASHSAAVANAVYAVEDTGQRFHLFYQASIAWHALFELILLLIVGSKRTREESDAIMDDPMIRNQLTRLTGLGCMTNDKGFQDMTRDWTKTLRPHQKALLEAMSKFEKIVFIAPTGGGKSISFTLPAFLLPESCVVVIQPTKALQMNTLETLTRLKISCAIYSSQALTPRCSVVLVTPDAMRYAQWRLFVRHRKEMQGIDRVILDEAHGILDSDGKFRLKYEGIRSHMDDVSHRQIYMTGTLPPTRQHDFLTLLRLTPVDPEKATILRYPTTRDNLRYIYVDEAVQLEIPDFVVALVEDVTASGGRSLIFCPSQDMCASVGSRLNIPAYHRGKTDPELEEVMNLWTEIGGALACTSLLGEGFDKSDVRFVVVLDVFPDEKLASTLQKFGRAGRDGRLATAMLIAPARKLPADFYNFRVSPCKRKAISQYLDGVGVECGMHHHACLDCARRLSRTIAPVWDLGIGHGVESPSLSQYGNLNPSGTARHAHSFANQPLPAPLPATRRLGTQSALDSPGDIINDTFPSSGPAVQSDIPGRDGGPLTTSDVPPPPGDIAPVPNAKPPAVSATDAGSASTSVPATDAGSASTSVPATDAGSASTSVPATSQLAVPGGPRDPVVSAGGDSIVSGGATSNTRRSVLRPHASAASNHTGTSIVAGNAHNSPVVHKNTTHQAGTATFKGLPPPKPRTDTPRNSSSSGLNTSTTSGTITSGLQTPTYVGFVRPTVSGHEHLPQPRKDQPRGAYTMQGELEAAEQARKQSEASKVDVAYITRLREHLIWLSAANDGEPEPCPYCSLSDPVNPPTHYLTECPAAGHIVPTCLTLKEGHPLENYACCFTCGLPQC